MLFLLLFLLLFIITVSLALLYLFFWVMVEWLVALLFTFETTQTRTSTVPLYLFF